MTETNTDIAVLGAGPAGSAAALFLARKGYAVTLLDRAVFPRDKPCGEYLTPGAVTLLRDEIGILPQLMAQGAARLTHETVVPHSGNAFGGDVNALACPRAVTDAVLMNAARVAGANVREGVHARHILFDGECVAGVAGTDRDGQPFSVRARMTIGADGTHSLLARALNVVRPLPRLQRLALVGHYAEAPPALLPATERERLGANNGGAGMESAFFSSAAPHYWGGGASFPIPPSLGAREPLPETGVTMHLPSDGSDSCCGVGAPCGPDGTRNVNIVVPVSEAGRMAGRREAYFEERLRGSFPRVWEQLAGAERVGSLRSVPCFGHHTARASGDGAMLVGDAATFIHPFTGEGIYFALRGAMLAADTVDFALRAGDTGARALASYDRARRQELLPRYQLCDWVQRVVHSPLLLEWAAGRLRRSHALTDALLRTVGDLSAPRELFSVDTLRLLWTA